MNNICVSRLEFTLKTTGSRTVFNYRAFPEQPGSVTHVYIHNGVGTRERIEITYRQTIYQFIIRLYMLPSLAILYPLHMTIKHYIMVNIEDLTIMICHTF